MPETAPRTIAVVGTGVAGATAALTLRQEGFDGRILLVGEELHPRTGVRLCPRTSSSRC